MTPAQLKVINSVSQWLSNLAEYRETLTAFGGVASKESGYSKKTYCYRINGEWVEIEQAIKTDPRAFNTVMLKIAEHVETDKPLPPFYKKIALQILKQEIKAPANKSYRLPRSEQYRVAVVMAVAALEMAGIVPTLSAETVTTAEGFKKAGCSIVAELITGVSNTDFGLVKRDYQAIESIWKKRERDLATKGKTGDLPLVAFWAGYIDPSHEDFMCGRGTFEQFIDDLKKQG